MDYHYVDTCQKRLEVPPVPKFCVSRGGVLSYEYKFFYFKIYLKSLAILACIKKVNFHLINYAILLHITLKSITSLTMKTSWSYFSIYLTLVTVIW